VAYSSETVVAAFYTM